jgi:GTP:adenosylcobinamide-phosphate guanylyltransferase
VVLAGGRGSRLGGEGKASLELAGRPMLAYVLEALNGALDEVAVAAKDSTGPSSPARSTCRSSLRRSDADLEEAAAELRRRRRV